MGGRTRQAPARIRTARPARIKNTPRHPKPMYAAPPSRSGPRKTPTEPAKVQRAILCSWRDGSRVHQRGLRETDESARGGVENHERNQQEYKIMAYSGQETSQSKKNPPAQNQNTPFPNIPQDTQERFDHVPDNSGQAERQANLDVVQVQVGADERPGCIGHAEDEFVNELNKKGRLRLTTGKYEISLTFRTVQCRITSSGRREQAEFRYNSLPSSSGFF